jgi:hypothetical protein
MKVNAALLIASLALSAEAVPTLVKRVAAPVNAGALALIEKLEGFRANFYTINGDQTIGRSITFDNLNTTHTHRFWT